MRILLSISLSFFSLTVGAQDGINHYRQLDSLRYHVFIKNIVAVRTFTNAHPFPKAYTWHDDNLFAQMNLLLGDVNNTRVYLIRTAGRGGFPK